MSTIVTYKGNTLATVDNATKTLLTAGKYCEDNFLLTDVSGSGGAVKLGTLRPDAERVQTWARDYLVVEDDGIVLPTTYSTSATTLKATETLGTYDGTPSTYRYFVVERTLTIPQYGITTKAKGRQDYVIHTGAYEWLYNPSGECISLDGTKSYGQYSQMLACGTMVRMVYWSSATAVGIYTSNSYGVNQAIQAAAIESNKTITIKSPTVTLRGHATYLPQTYYEALTDIRCQYIIELWRAPVEQDVVTGWVHGSQLASALDNVQNNSGTLT